MNTGAKFFGSIRQFVHPLANFLAFFFNCFAFFGGRVLQLVELGLDHERVLPFDKRMESSLEFLKIRCTALDELIIRDGRDI